MEERREHKKRRLTIKDLIIWLLIAVVISAVFVFVFNSSSYDFTDKANKFFEAAKQNNYLVAINYLSNNLKNTMTPIQQEKFINRMAEVDFRSAQWETRTISDNLVELLGRINNSTGNVSEVDVVFISEGDDWKILGVKTQLASDASKELAKSIPPLDTLKNMADSSLVLIAQSINAGTFFDLYKEISRNWRLKTSESQLQSKFNEYKDKNIDLTPSKSFGLVFSEVPVISDKGDLVLKGYYPAKTIPVSFVLSYRYEAFQWKLDDVDISTE